MDAEEGVVKLAYEFKILAALPGDAPIELYRSRYPYRPAMWHAITDDLSPEWETWLEYPLKDHQTLTERPKVREYKIQGRSARSRPDCRVHSISLP